MAAAFILEHINVISVIVIVKIGLSSPMPPKSVNLALETSFLIEPNDVLHLASFMENSRRFLGKLESLFSPTEIGGSAFKAVNYTNADDDNISNYTGNDTLTKFLTELGGVIMNYDEDELKALAAALNDEITTNYVSNSKFHAMFEDVAMRTFIKNTVREWTTAEPLALKLDIANYITSNQRSAFVIFFRNLNRFFESDKEELQELVKKFLKAKNTKNFSKPIRKAFKFIFRQYEKMDDNLKSSFRGELDKLTKYILINYKHRLPIENDRRSNPDQSTVSSSKGVKDYDNSCSSIENTNNYANEIRFDKEVQFSVNPSNH